MSKFLQQVIDPLCVGKTGVANLQLSETPHTPTRQQSRVDVD